MFITKFLYLLILAFPTGIMSQDQTGNPHIIAYKLDRAAQYGNITEVQALLDQGADINGADINGHDVCFRPLVTAARYQQADLMQFLLDRGADVNIQDFHGDTPLHMIAYHCPLDKIELLCDILINHKKIHINKTNNVGQTALHIASMWGQVNLVRLLLDYGANVHILTESKDTVLSYAKTFCIAKSQKDIIQLLEKAERHSATSL